MAVLKLDIRKDHKNELGESSIIVKYNATGEKSPLRISTGVYVNKDFFTNGVITDPSIPAAARKERQSQIDDIKKRVEHVRDSFREEGIDQPLGRDIKARYDELYNQRKEEPEEPESPAPVQLSPFETLDLLIEESENGKRRSKSGDKVVYGTLKNYKSARAILQTFVKETGYKLDKWEDFTYDDFYLKFTDFCFDTQKYYDNNTGRYVKNIRTFLNYALEKKFIPNKIYDKRWIVWKEENVDSFVLYPDELKIISRLTDDELKTIKNGIRTRDLFIVGCLTCVRVSDLMRLGDYLTRIGDDYYFKYSQTKTQNNVGNKVHPLGTAIINKYLSTEEGFPSITDVTYNKDLKEFGRFVKRYMINNKAKFKTQGKELQDWESAFSKARRRRGKVVKTEKIPFEKVFTTHLMRRTGITSLFIAGLKPHEIMKISGHKTIGELQKYEKVADRFINKSSNEAWDKLLM
jgi:integrase